jgi:uncharacterized protein involved in cysteine biosynthesis
VIAALTKAFVQLGDSKIQRLVLLSVAAALAVLALLGLALWFLLTSLAAFGIDWLDIGVQVATGFALLLLAWLLFPAAVSLIVGLFVEEVAAAVEARYYPGLSPPRSIPLAEEILTGLRFAGLALLINLVALPVYLILLFFPPLYAFVFYAVNGYLLGREYFELVAMRRLGRRQTGELRRAYRHRLFVGGVIIAVLLTIPLLNLIAPVIATAFMLHLFEATRPPSAA